MFRKIFDEVYQSIGSNVFTLTGMNLVELKRGFYDKSTEYMGHSKNLTGITELLVSMYLAHYLLKKELPLKIEHNAKRIGENRRENEVDIAFSDPANSIVSLKKPKIITGFSIKKEVGGANWKEHENQSEYCQSLRQKYGNSNLTQDLFRLQNMKRGSNGSFRSCTFIFEQVPLKYKSCLEAISRDFPNHSYILLFDNHIPLWEQISVSN